MLFTNNQLTIGCYASVLTYGDLLEKKGGISSPMDSPSSQKSSPSAFVLSPRATIRPIGFLRLQQNESRFLLRDHLFTAYSLQLSSHLKPFFW